MTSSEYTCYSISSEQNDKPDQGYENSVISAGIGTSFEQFKDVIVGLGLDASYDDLRTEESASSSLKKQAGNFQNFQQTMASLSIKEIEYLCLQVER